jgi:hypothetical protein
VPLAATLVVPLGGLLVAAGIALALARVLGRELSAGPAARHLDGPRNGRPARLRGGR